MALGYLFLSVSLLSGAVKGFCGKKSGGYVTEFRDSMLINLIRMILCIAIGGGVLGFSGEFSNLGLGLNGILISALSGVTTSVFVITWLLSIRKGAYMLVDVFLMLGVLVTILSCWAAFGDQPTLKQGIGFAILLLAVFLMCSYQTSLKGKLSIVALILLVICGVSSGLTGFSQELFLASYGKDASIPVFQFYTYVFSALTLLVFYIATGFWGKKKKAPIPKVSGSFWQELKKKLPLILLLYIFIMAVCLYLNSFFRTKAAVYLDPLQLYPLSQGGGLLLSTAMAAIFFKEKPTVTSIIGVCLAFVALLLINL